MLLAPAGGAVPAASAGPANTGCLMWLVTATVGCVQLSVYSQP